MPKLLTQNAKMKKSGGSRYSLWNFGITAYKVELDNGKMFTTCPWAGDCSGPCYAQQKTYTWPVVKNAYRERFLATLTDEFVGQVAKEIKALKKRIKKQLVIRIHDSGDFYNAKYLGKWLEVMAEFPDVIFYAYTKAIMLHQAYDLKQRLPANYKWIQSEGGTQDELIDYSKPHARVFSSDAELAMAGYEDAMHDDSVAFRTLTGRIGLVYHGAKAKQWTTATPKPVKPTRFTEDDLEFMARTLEY